MTTFIPEFSTRLPRGCSHGHYQERVSRLEAASKDTPSVASLKKYAAAVGGTLKIELVPAVTKRA
ncbi:MAG: hypothetical protein Q7J21_06855 [Rugosibacter sp.]|nr:hypothetical protein [Rugosibacter sp.]